MSDNCTPRQVKIDKFNANSQYVFKSPRVLDILIHLI